MWSKINLFTKEISLYKAVTHNVNKENASIFSTEVIATCFLVFYYYSGVAPIITTTIKNTHTQKKLPHWKNDSPKSNEMGKVKPFA